MPALAKRELTELEAPSSARGGRGRGGRRQSEAAAAIGRGGHLDRDGQLPNPPHRLLDRLGIACALSAHDVLAQLKAAGRRHAVTPAEHPEVPGPVCG